MTENKPKLDEFETEYAQKVFREFADADQMLQQAQANWNDKNAKAIGFFETMKAKYNLPDASRLSAEGEIVLPDQSEKTENSAD